jgi:hypothetical protein
LKLKIFTFRFSESIGGFDDKPLQEFIADKEVIEFAEHFFIHENTPHLTVIISYRLLAAEEKRKLGRRQDPRGELDDREKEAYDAVCLRIHRLCQGTDPMPQPVPRCNRGQTCPARRLLVGPMARKLPPGKILM